MKTWIGIIGNLAVSPRYLRTLVTIVCIRSYVNGLLKISLSASILSWSVRYISISEEDDALRDCGVCVRVYVCERVRACVMLCACHVCVFMFVYVRVVCVCVFGCVCGVNVPIGGLQRLAPLVSILRKLLGLRPWSSLPCYRNAPQFAYRLGELK